MSRVGPEARSFAPISHADLSRLADLAEADLYAFFGSHPVWAAQYRRRVLGVALCQGAALHYLGAGTGINDFDVYTFFARHPARPWFAQRIKRVDLGDPRFGTSIDRPAYRGRRVDLCGRSLDVAPDADPADAIRAWLRRSRPGQSGHYLAQKAVVLLTPRPRLGEVVWDARASANAGFCSPF
jgi:hypothetical protein